jgi:hypothetical protein
LNVRQETCGRGFVPDIPSGDGFLPGAALEELLDER